MAKTSSNGTMAKRGGTKRKIPIKRIENKQSRAVTFSKRTKGLFSKAAELCHLSPGSQIAILVGPLSSESKVSFHSFGHSSVDAVLSAFLSGQPLAPPVVETIMREDVKVRRDLGLRFWWDEKMPDTPEDLREAIKSVSKLMTDLHAYRAEKLIREHHQRNNDQGTHELDQTLNLPHTETEMVVLDDDDFDHHDDDLPCALNNSDQSLVMNSNEFIDWETLDTLISNDGGLPLTNNNFEAQELDQTLNLPQSSDFLNNTETEMVVLDDDLPCAFNNIDQSYDDYVDFETLNNNNDFDKHADGCSNNHYNDFIDRETFDRILSNGNDLPAASLNNNNNNNFEGNLEACSNNQEMEDDQISDFETYLENILSNEDISPAAFNNNNDFETYLNV